MLPSLRRSSDSSRLAAGITLCGSGTVPVQSLPSSHGQMSVSFFFACPHSLFREGLEGGGGFPGPYLGPMHLCSCLASEPRLTQEVWAGLEFVFNKLCRRTCGVAGADSLGLHLSVSGPEAVVVSKTGAPRRSQDLVWGDSKGAGWGWLALVCSKGAQSPLCPRPLGLTVF